jgi:hypothetical protein
MPNDFYPDNKTVPRRTIFGLEYAFKKLISCPVSFLKALTKIIFPTNFKLSISAPIRCFERKRVRGTLRQ